MKQFEIDKKEHAQQQMEQIIQNNDMGKSHIIEKWEEQEVQLDDEDLLSGFSEKLDDKMDSRPLLSDMF